MSRAPFTSYAQNGEDVVLWRALGHLDSGRYVDVGANDPTEFSISRAFYDAGWSGITVEPVEHWAALHREQRPRDVLHQVAITDADVEHVVLHEVTDTGLSTLAADIADRHAEAGFDTHDEVVAARRLDDVLAEAAWQGEEIHFMTVDVEGAEAAVMNSVDLRKWRPWVLVIEATAPLSTVATHAEWEHLVLDADYQFCLFDGVSRYYVAAEHAAGLADKLSHPACVLDDYTSPYQRAHEQIESAMQAHIDGIREQADAAVRDKKLAEEEMLRWRAQAVSNWADTVAREASEADVLRREIDAVRATLSWRVTRPLRLVQRLRIAAAERRGPSGPAQH